jgi:hypothetical protein
MEVLSLSSDSPEGLGITSLNLNANATNIALPDGSSIDGETTYTTSSGATGTAATIPQKENARGERAFSVVLANLGVVGSSTHAAPLWGLVKRRVNSQNHQRTTDAFELVMATGLPALMTRAVCAYPSSELL